MWDINKTLLKAKLRSGSTTRISEARRGDVMGQDACTEASRRQYTQRMRSTSTWEDEVKLHFNDSRLPNFKGIKPLCRATRDSAPAPAESSHILSSWPVSSCSFSCSSQFLAALGPSLGSPAPQIQGTPRCHRKQEGEAPPGLLPAHSPFCTCWKKWA